MDQTLMAAFVVLAALSMADFVMHRLEDQNQQNDQTRKEPNQ